jgi:hypothetical protein
VSAGLLRARLAGRRGRRQTATRPKCRRRLFVFMTNRESPASKKGFEREASNTFRSFWNSPRCTTMKLDSRHGMDGESHKI